MFPITPKQKIFVIFLLFIIGTTTSYLFFDQAVCLYLAKNMSTKATRLSQTLTFPIEPLMVPLYILLVLNLIQHSSKRVSEWIHQGTATLITITSVSILKYVFSRPRPSYFLSTGIAQISFLNLQGDFISMPSGHAAGAGLVAAFIVIFFKKNWRWTIILPITLAVLRVVCLKHFLSDIILGFGLGFCTALFFHLYDKTWIDKIKEKLWKNSNLV